MPDITAASVVMVGTTHPGNIGAAARAMGVMGLAHLLLARPMTSHTDSEAVARATGSGTILDQASSFTSLAKALASHQCAYAYTARRRGMGHDMIDAHEAGKRAAKDLAAGNRVALVFGPEKAGLNNEEIQMCDCIVEIPTRDNKSSLNVASAVQVACYELRMALIGQAPVPKRDLATKKEIEDALEHMEAMVEKICAPKHPSLQAKMLARLRMLLNRANPAKSDIRMLRGMLGSIEDATRDD